MYLQNSIFTSESVSEGHPDKVCDAVSDAILDACLAQDPQSRVACESLAKTGLLVVAGEITTKAKFDYADVARAAVRAIGYDNDDVGYNADRVNVVIALQSIRSRRLDWQEGLLEQGRDIGASGRRI